MDYRTNILRLLHLLLFILFPIISFSQEIKSVRIIGISVEGNVFSDPETIISISGLSVGDEIRVPFDNKLQIAIKNLWNRKQFSQVEIIKDREVSNGVFLIIRVKELPRINAITIIGNEEVKESQIRKTIGKSYRDPISPNDIYLIKNRLKKLYIENGLMFAQIDVRLEETDSVNFVNLYIEIQEGLEFKVSKIEFEGNNFFDASDLKGAFEETKEKVWWMFWRSSKFDINKYEKDKELLINFYKKNGFIDAEIIKDTLIFDEKEKRVKIVISLKEGNRYYIRNITFTGNTTYSTDLLLKRLDFKKGDYYNVEKFNQNLLGNQESTDALSLYLDNGFLFSRMETDEIRVSEDSVDINIRVIEGDRVTIRRVDIVGNTKTKDKVIRRELYTQPGDYFNKSAVIRSIRALGVLNYFNPETLRPDVKNVDMSSVDIIYKVEERSTDQINASIGFAGTYGLTGSIGLSLNNFSISEPLLGGAGQVFNFNWEFGQMNRMQNISIGFAEPWLFDEPITVGFNLFDSRLSYYFNLRRRGFALNVGRRFRWPDDYFRVDWSLLIQNNIVDQTSEYYYKPGLEISLGQTISRINTDHLFFPSVGSKFSFSTNFALGSLGLGKTDFFKNHLNLEIYQPLMEIGGINRLVLMLGTNLGYLVSFKSDTAVSPLELYYMGGSGIGGWGITPLRGYPDRSIGPSIGGRVLAKHTAELRFAVSLDPMPLYFYAFAEAGNVWQNLKKADFFDLKRSAGVGVQVFINPLGLIGFSYGYGFDPVGTSQQKSGWRFLFHINQ